MKKGLFSLRSVGMTAAFAMATLGMCTAPALADNAPADISACTTPQLSQPFASANDFNWYAYAPGESTDSFIGTGWRLSGGAKVVSTKLADGADGSVLDLPSGSKVVSPVMCVNSDYSQVKAMVRTLAGGGGVGVFVAYEGTNTWDNPKHTGDLNGPGQGWGQSSQANLQPANRTGYQLVQITLEPNGNNNEFQVYDLASKADSTLAANSVDASTCTPPTVSQPFLSAGDSNWYTLAPGQSSSGFEGTGWTLTGGAKIVQTETPDGTTSVLDLPAGSRAVSPVMCVTSDYPEARALVHSLKGGGGVALNVAYDGTTTWGHPHHTGDLNGPGHGWGVSGKTGIQPGNRIGWQLVQFTLVPNGGDNEYQVVDFQVDPRCR
jgi:hypothetical protein